MDERPGRPSWFRDKRSERWGLGDAIRLRREEIALSRREVAERAGLSYPYLSELETGKKRGSPDSIRAVAEALGLGQDELWARADALAAGAAPHEAPSGTAPFDASVQLARSAPIAEPAPAPPPPAAKRESPALEPAPVPAPEELAQAVADVLAGATAEEAETALLMLLGELRFREAGPKEKPEGKFWV